MTLAVSCQPPMVLDRRDDHRKQLSHDMGDVVRAKPLLGSPSPAAGHLADMAQHHGPMQMVEPRCPARNL